MMSLLLLLFMILSFHCKLIFAQLNLEVYNNSALVVSVRDRVQQQQQEEELINSLTNVTIHNPSTLTTTPTTSTSPPPFSARIQGILNLSNYSYLQGFIFDCSSLYSDNNNISGAFIWIDDHLICQKSVLCNNNNTHTYNEAMDGTTLSLPLRKLRKTNLTIRIHLWSNSSNISFSLRWYVIPNETSSKNNNNNNNQNISSIQYTDIPSNLFSPNISKFENQRLQLTEHLNQGWNTWLLHSVMDFILLPEGIQIGIRICQNNNNHQYTDSNSISNSTTTTTTTTTTTATNNNKHCLTSAIPTDRNVRVTSPIIVVPPSTGNNSNDDSVGRTYMKYHVMTSFDVNVTITMSSVQHNLNNNNEASSSSNDLLSKDLPSQEGEVDDRLWILIETITCPDDDDDDDDCSNNYSIHLIGDIAYKPFRSGYVQPTSQGGINITATGLRSIIVHPTTSDNNEISSSSSSTSSEATSSSRNNRILKKNSIDDEHNNNHVGDDDDHINEIVIPLPGVGRYVGFTTDPFPLPSASMMKQRLQQIEQDEINKHTKRYSSTSSRRSPAGTNNGHNNNNSTMMLVETLMAVQAGVLYNLIYTPAELSPITVVSRNWWYRKEIFRSDMDYIIFNWDTVLASYLLGKTTSKQISYSNLIQVVKSKTANGFIPNYSANGAKSQDRTEPPLAAKVLYELYQEYDDTWIVELLWDDIADYIDWFDRERVLSPFNLIALGSNPFDYVNATSPHNMQGARYESGLDNSPMYDGNCYDPKTNVMQMYDVGMTSLYIQECDYLSKLASIIGNDKGHTEMKSRANTMRKKLLHHLWDPKQKIFVNRYRNGTYSNRISPTSFYPLGVLLNDGIHYLNNDDDDDGDIHDRASYMIQHWLFNRSRFCIDVNWPNNDGDGFHSGNSDDCWWGLPSISADDPAFPKLGYWRGYVWGPMAQLTYWSLQQQQQRQQQSSTTAASTSATSSSIDNYRILAKQARKALSNQMGELFLTMWRRHAHICENYSPHKDDAAEEDCTGDTFYHWGGLAGLLVLLEAAEEEEIIVEEEVDVDSSPSTTLVEGMVIKNQ